MTETAAAAPFALNNLHLDEEDRQTGRKTGRPTWLQNRHDARAGGRFFKCRFAAPYPSAITHSYACSFVKIESP